ncbi:MAG: DUF4163 domain-containing protein [Treponema sp.]
MKQMYRRTVRFGFMLLMSCIMPNAFADTKVHQENPGIQYEVKIGYPVFEKEPLLSAQVAEIVQQTLNNFNKDFFSANIPLYQQGFECIISNTAVYEDIHHISFLLKIYQYSGGAHGITTLIPVTFSKQTKKLLSLKEAVQPAKKNWLSSLSAEARRLLNEQVTKGSFSSNQSWIEKGTEPDQENFAVFTLEKDAVRIIFSQYQVGPYSSGMPEIVLPRTFFK